MKMMTALGVASQSPPAQATAPTTEQLREEWHEVTSEAGSGPRSVPASPRTKVSLGSACWGLLKEARVWLHHSIQVKCPGSQLCYGTMQHWDS